MGSRFPTRNMRSRMNKPAVGWTELGKRLEKTTIRGEVHTPTGTPSDKSFPSGHTQTAFGAATYLSCLYPAASPIFLGLAALTGLSRIALGVHYPSDVLAGALFGIVFSLLGFRFYRSYLVRKSKSQG